MIVLILGTIPLALGAIYQDEQWKKIAKADKEILIYHSYGMNKTAHNDDWLGLSIFADSIYADSQVAIYNSNSFEVSPSLQSTKEEYNLGMEQAKNDSIYLKRGAEEAIKGNYESAKADFDESLQFQNSSIMHLKNVAPKLTTPEYSSVDEAASNLYSNFKTYSNAIRIATGQKPLNL